MEVNNLRFQEKYRKMEAEEVRFEEIMCDDAEYILIAFGTSSRICQKSIELARAKGIKVGLLRPITLYPFPRQAVANLARRAKGFLVVEMSAGQMIEDVKLGVNGKKPVHFTGRMGGMIPDPEVIFNEIVRIVEQKEAKKV